MRAVSILLRLRRAPGGLGGRASIELCAKVAAPPMSDVPSPNLIGDAFGGRPPCHAAPHHSAPTPPRFFATQLASATAGRESYAKRRPGGPAQDFCVGPPGLNRLFFRQPVAHATG